MNSPPWKEAEETPGSNFKKNNKSKPHKKRTAADLTVLSVDPSFIFYN